MKKNIWNVLSTVFLLVWLSPFLSFAEGGNEVRLDQEGTVTIIFPSAAAEEISSLQFSVTVDAGNAERVEFAFDESNAKITEYRYNKDEKKLNVYVAGTEALFADSTNALKMGRVIVLDGDGKEAAATVSVIADSVQYVYGTELRTMESVTVSEPVQINQGSGSTGGDNSQDDDSDDDDSDDDSNNDDSDDDEDSTDSAGQGTVPSQGTVNQGQRPNNGNQIAGNRPQGNGGGTQGTNSGSQTTGSTAMNTPVPSAVPTPAPTPSAVPTPSADSSSGEASQPSTVPEMIPTGSDNQNKTESSGGINWLWVAVAIVVILFVGVAVMAVVVLNGKPKKQDDFYDEGNDS